MKRMTLYSSSSSRSACEAQPVHTDSRAAAATGAVSRGQARGRRAFAARAQRYRAPLWLGMGIALALVAVFINAQLAPPSLLLTQAEVVSAVRDSLQKKPLPSNASRAYLAISPSVVRVRGYGKGMNKITGEVSEFERGVGSGVVIVDKGLILTNLHVVSGNERISVVFADGSESDATVVGLQPQHDLAVLQAKTIPDDLVAATLRSSNDLKPGDEVIAVGFPFGFGPSASAGIVSGLKREFRSPKGERTLTNLIQFDAAANPGNSGGPLVNARGEVVGIVTAILSPGREREGFFVGLGFAVPIEEAAGGVGVAPF